MVLLYLEIRGEKKMTCTDFADVAARDFQTPTDFAEVAARDF